MNPEKLCPMMAQGWLANKYSANGEFKFHPDNLPKCVEKDCALWLEHMGRCGLKRV